MAFKRDDDNLALMGKALADAIEAEDNVMRGVHLQTARLRADDVLNRGKKKEKPAEPAEGETSGPA
jgi:hypothetical protein